LKLAKKSFGQLEKELKVTLKDFYSNEEFLALLPVVRMLNITAAESLIPFATSQNTIPPEAFPALDRIAGAIMELKPYRIVIEGHTDTSGSPYNNRRLSKRRADEVTLYLQKKTGLPGKRFLSKGMGSDHPLVKEDSPELMAKNRRVEIWLELRGL
jgi:outer membrane protein OmpA-like peptidoglycan-associated protein